MSQLGPIPRKRLIDGLKVVLPTVILVAMGFGLLYRVNQTLLPAALDFATAAAVGLTAGLTTRWSLKGRAGLVHAIVAIAMTISGLIILGVITSGQAGIKMLVFRTGVDWNGLAQLTIGGATALLALRAWRRTMVQILPTPTTVPERLAPRPVSQPATTHSRRHQRRVSLPSRRAEPAHRIISAPRLSRIIAIPRWKPPHITLPNFNFRNLLNFRDSAVKVTGVTEQRCPYCLDVIERNDPRGVRVCSTCHTPHHADCWALTGVCQIPHYHA